MPGPRHLTALICCGAVLAATACEREEEQENPYLPGGEFQTKLDARGTRVMVRDADGKTLAKLRNRRETIRVYGPQMVVLGEVAFEATSDPPLVRVEPRGGEPEEFVSGESGVWKLGERLRLELVSDGWAVYGPRATRLGYVSKPEEGKFAVRDDYSSAPRAFARVGEAVVKTPAGASIVTTTPDADAVVVLPFALEGIDPLAAVALGKWLELGGVTELPPRPDASPSPADAPDASIADAEIGDSDQSP